MYWLLDALYEYVYIIYYMCVYNKHNICKYIYIYIKGFRLRGARRLVKPPGPVSLAVAPSDCRRGRWALQSTPLELC